MLSFVPLNARHKIWRLASGILAVVDRCAHKQPAEPGSHYRDNDTNLDPLGFHLIPTLAGLVEEDRWAGQHHPNKGARQGCCQLMIRILAHEATGAPTLHQALPLQNTDVACSDPHTNRWHRGQARSGAPPFDLSLIHISEPTRPY